MERLHLQDIIQDMEDNFNIQKFFKNQYLTEDYTSEYDAETAKRNMFAASYNKEGDTERFRDYMEFLTKLRDSGKTNMFGAAPYLQQAFDLEKKEARELLAYWMGSYRNDESLKKNNPEDGKAAPHGSGYNKLNENEALNSRSEAYYKELVPGSGNSDKLEGEILRAINRIIYRHYNDGDFFDKGYGIETAGPAHSFLVNSREIPFELQSTLTSIFSKAEGLGFKNNDDGYERLMYLALEKILDYIDSKEGVYTDNKDDIFNYESEFEDLDDEDEYDEADDDYGYDEDEDEDY